VTGKRFRQGLVVGKFAPLHRGHQLVIDEARAQCDQVCVLSYSRPEFAGSEPSRRRIWLESLFPDVQVCVIDEAWRHAWGSRVPHNDEAGEVHREFVARMCHETLRVAPDAVFTSEDYGSPFAAALTEYFRDRLAKQHTVTHVPVDPLRQRVPISGSAIRADLYQQRRWLPPGVYESTIARVVLLGAESSGKTTLTRALARAHRTQHVEEYGRELWLERNGVLDEGDLLAIAREQVRREQAALYDCRAVLFCDTSPLTTLQYSRLMFGRTDPELERLARRDYALTVYCAPDFAFVQDGTRRGAAFRAEQHELTKGELVRRGIDYIEVSGPVEYRVQTVLAALSERGLIRGI
jgi:HTH-type transcriptional regulator, transcriptional repressor of NAD biosynthesis genes